MDTKNDGRIFGIAFLASFIIGEITIFVLSSIAFFPFFKSYWGGIFTIGYPGQRAYFYMAFFHLIVSVLYGFWITTIQKKGAHIHFKDIVIALSSILGITCILLSIIGIIPAVISEYTSTVRMGPGTGGVTDAIFIIKSILFISVILYFSVGTVITTRLIKRLQLHYVSQKHTPLS